MKESVFGLREKTKQHWFSCYWIASQYCQSVM